MTQQSFGLIGLAVMGENLALNVERNGFPVSVYNRTSAVTQKFMDTRAKGKNFHAAYSPLKILLNPWSDLVRF